MLRCQARRRAGSSLVRVTPAAALSRRFVSEASATPSRGRVVLPDDGDREARGDAATRRAAGAEPDRPDPPPGVRAPDPARPRRGRGGVGGAGRRGVRGAAVRLRPRPRAREEVPGVAGGRGQVGRRDRRRSSTPRDDVARRRRPSRRCAAASTSSTRARSSTAPGAGRPTSCSASRRRRCFGDWSYEIADTKLARKLKVAALLQMATYAERLTVLQGVAPECIHVVTGDGVSRPWRLIDVAAYARRARARLEAFVAAPPATGPSPIGYCEQCRWAERCNTELRQADDLGLVAFMRGDHRDALRAVGIATLARPGDGDAGAAEVVGHRRRRAHPAAAAGGRAAERADDRAAVAHAARPAARPGAAAPAAAEPRRPLPRLRGRSLVRGRRGHRVPRRPRGPVGRLHRAVGARPAGGEADGRRPDRPAGRGGAGRPGACTSTTTRPTR